MDRATSAVSFSCRILYVFWFLFAFMHDSHDLCVCVLSDARRPVGALVLSACAAHQRRMHGCTCKSASPRIMTSEILPMRRGVEPPERPSTCAQQRSKRSGYALDQVRFRSPAAQCDSNQRERSMSLVEAVKAQSFEGASRGCMDFQGALGLLVPNTSWPVVTANITMALCRALHKIAFHVCSIATTYR